MATLRIARHARRTAHIASPWSRGAEKSLQEIDFDGTPSAAVMHGFYEVGSVPLGTAFSPQDVETGVLSVLVVEPAVDELLLITSSLSAAGFHVTAAASYTQARTILEGARAPAVLVTTLRLGMYNGLHLVVRGRCVQPRLAALVTALPEDAPIQTEAEGLGATFMVKPTTSQEFVGAILQTYFRRNPSTGPIRAPFERRQGERRTDAQPAAEERRRQERRRKLPWLQSPRAD